MKKKYDVNKLYIGYVYKNCSEKKDVFNIENPDKYVKIIIFQINSKYDWLNEETIKYAFDIIQESIYLILDFCVNRSVRLAESIAPIDYMVVKYEPLKIKWNKKWITDKEILELYDKFNKIEKGEEKTLKEENLSVESDEEMLTDGILKNLIRLQEKVNLSNLDSEDKERLYDKINEIAKYYYEESLKCLAESNLKLSLTSGLYEVKRKCADMMANIESLLIKPELEQKAALKRQLAIFNKKTNSKKGDGYK